MKKKMAKLIVFISLMSAILFWPSIKTFADHIACYIQSEWLAGLGNKVCVYNCAGETWEIMIDDKKQCAMRIQPGHF